MTACSMTRSKVKVKVTTHEPLKVGNLAIFKGYLLPIYKEGWQMTTDS